MEQADVFVVLDDKKARRIAKQLGLKVMGTVGLLLRAKKKGIVSEIKPMLDALQQADFRIHNGL
jgi:predicted nucleic acid-binding protein